MLDDLHRFTNVFVSYVDIDGYPITLHTTFELISDTLKLPSLTPNSALLTLTFIAPISSVPFEGSEYITIQGYLQEDHSIVIVNRHKHVYEKYIDYIQQFIPDAKDYIQSFNQNLATNTLAKNSSAMLLVAVGNPISRYITYSLVRENVISADLPITDPVLSHLKLQNRVKLIFSVDIVMHGICKVTSKNTSKATIEITIFKLSYGSNQEIETYEFKQYTPTVLQALQNTVGGKLKFLYYGLRIPFVVITLLAFLLGTAVAYYVLGTIRLDLFIVAFVALGLLQISANLLNDYFDDQTDVYNYQLQFPHTTFYHGGSRFIQNEIVDPSIFLFSGIVTAIFGIFFGFWLIFLLPSFVRLPILLFGIFGLSFAIFYSAPPFRIAYHGFGEASIAITWVYLPTLGAYFLQTFSLNYLILVIAIPATLHIFAFSIANGSQDVIADSRAHKRTLAVMFGIINAYKILFVVLLSEYLLYLLLVFLQFIPLYSLSVLFVLFFHVNTFKNIRLNDFHGTLAVNKNLFYTYWLLAFIFGVSLYITHPL